MQKKPVFFETPLQSAQAAHLLAVTTMRNSALHIRCIFLMAPRCVMTNIELRKR